MITFVIDFLMAFAQGFNEARSKATKETTPGQKLFDHKTTVKLLSFEEALKRAKERGDWRSRR